VPNLIPEERPETACAALILAVVEVLQCRAHQQRIGEHRGPEPNETLARELRRAPAIERRATQPPRDQEEQPEAEQPADHDHDRQRIDENARHLVVGLQVPRAVEAVGDRGMDRDHADHEQDLQVVKVGEPLHHIGGPVRSHAT
jgi:hypothetical protein